jgi:hypothetical protein
MITDAHDDVIGGCGQVCTTMVSTGFVNIAVANVAIKAASILTGLHRNNVQMNTQLHEGAIGGCGRVCAGGVSVVIRGAGTKVQVICVVCSSDGQIVVAIPRIHHLRSVMRAYLRVVGRGYRN